MTGKLTSPDGLRAAAEDQLAVRELAVAEVSAERLLHELQVHQIELEMQNETLRETLVALEESRDRYVDLYEFAPVGYVTVSAAGLIVGINLTGADLLGEERGKLRGLRFARCVAAEDREAWQRYFAQVLRQEERSACELGLRRGDGKCFDARLDCQSGQAGDGERSLRITLTDVTVRKQAENDLRIAAIAFEAQEGMMVTDARGVIIRVNRAFTHLTGYEAAEVIGQSPGLLRSGRHDPAFYQRMWQALKDSGYWQGEIWNRRKNGKIYAEWLTISAVTSPEGVTTHYVGTFSEITENKEAEAEIHRLAHYDALTHLPNRRLLQDRIHQALVGGSRSGRYGALLFLDLDHFKNLNDTRGHDAGDQLLVEMARRLQACVRQGDTVARLGGDEFVVMLEDLDAEAAEAAVQAEQVGENILVALARPCDLEGYEFHCTVSIGVALFHNSDETVESLLKHADMALYKAKNAGRNTLRFFDPAMQTALDARSALENDLRLAVERGELQLHYQAQVDGTRRIIGAEALLRWQHPERGLVPPGDFIPLAEDTDLILPVGHWVLETACARLKAWSAAPETREFRLAVNVSARQFRQKDFVAQVKRIVAHSGADPSRLKIELTESMVLDDIGDTFDKMRALKAEGIGFSLDDFGTGHSSLSYLSRLPLDQLKIDRSFVLNLPNNHNDGVIAQTIISMARSLGLDVIAEGVETEAQREFLERHQCHAYQGFLFSRPLPLAEFDELLKRVT